MKVQFKILYLCLAIFFELSSFAQEFRDPTASSQVGTQLKTEPSVQTTFQSLPSFSGSFSYISRDGNNSVLYEGHTYKVGDSINGFRIEKLSESKIGFKSGKSIYWVSYFVGVVKLDPEEPCVKSKKSDSLKSTKSKTSCFREKK